MRSFVRKVPPFPYRNTIPLKPLSLLFWGSQFYNDFNDLLEKEVPIKQGIFAADMAIELINDGPGNHHPRYEKYIEKHALNQRACFSM